MSRDRLFSIAAYEILSDTDKRQRYDRYGEAAFEQDNGNDGGFHHFNMNDFFKDFDFFQTHHSADDFKSHGSEEPKGRFFQNLFDDDDDDHFGSFTSMFGHGDNDGGELFSSDSEQTFSSGKCRIVRVFGEVGGISSIHNRLQCACVLVDE